MKLVLTTLAVAVVLAGAVRPCAAWAADGAVVRGVVRDGHGVPQMGAVVELLGPDAVVLARAFTDDRGRYLLSSSLPGSYALRASAAFLVPVVRSDIRLRAGAQAVADLTMTAIFEAASWLPAEGRRSGEAADDWRWTLRSTANRPMLRLVEDDGTSVGGDTSSSEAQPSRAKSEGQLAFVGGDGTFGKGGAREVFSLDRAGMDGGISVVRASLGSALASGVGPSVAVAAGTERKRIFGGETRVFVSFSSNPELQTNAGPGLEVLRTAATERVALGDLVAIDAGTLFTAERLFGTRFESAPYVRVAFRPSPELVVEYRLATDRDLQKTEDLDHVDLPEQALSDGEGHPLLQRGLHQEIAVTHLEEKRVVSLAVYRDSVPFVGVSGGGHVPLQGLGSLPVLVDPGTGTFRLALPGYAAGDGARATWTQIFSPVFSACLQGEFGTALTNDMGLDRVSDVAGQMKARTVAGLGASVDAHVKRTGTALDVRYRWQPRRSLSQVDEFDAAPGDAYLGMRIEQRLWAGRRLRGVRAVAEATNLLAQGYEPLLGADGETLFLAQVPRGLQGGLAFTF